MIRTAFLGTPRSAVPALETLAALTDLRLVVTRPDRPRGRSRRPVPSETKSRAVEIGIPVSQPADSQHLDSVLAPLDIDVIVAAAYGMLIPPAVLARLGAVNLHFSLLPRWRGAAPVQRAVLAGDPAAGVTLMQMEEGLDTGGILAAWGTSIGWDETAGSLTDRLAAGGAELLGRNLEALAAGALTPIPQDASRATWAPPVSTAEARLDFTRPAVEVVRAVRAFCPRPGAHTTWRGERFKIYGGRVVHGDMEPGRLEAGPAGVRVGAAEGCVELLEVQPAGARKMEVGRWLLGVRGDLGRLE